MFVGASARSQYLRYHVLGVSFFLTVAAGLIAAKTIAFSAVVMFAIIVASEVRTWRDGLDYLKANHLVLILGLLIVYAGLSLAWTPNPGTAAKHFAYFAISSTGMFVCVALLTRAEISSSKALMIASVWGCAIGIAYLATRQLNGIFMEKSFLPFSISKLIKFRTGEITRNFTPITLWIFPSLLWLLSALRPPMNKVLAGLLLAGATFTIAISPHETSKMALAASVATLLLASISTRAAVRILAFGWIACWLLVVPVSIFGFSYELQHSTWLPPTAQQRILIWNVVGLDVLDHPISGRGLGSTQANSPAIPDLSEFAYQQRNLPVPPNLTVFRANHAHNAYLQVWYELGAIGAALFMCLGLAILGAINRLEPQQQPAMLATFGAASVILLPSYGIWQSWFIGMFALGVIMCAAACRSTSKKPNILSEVRLRQ